MGFGQAIANHDDHLKVLIGLRAQTGQGDGFHELEPLLQAVGILHRERQCGPRMVSCST